MHQKQLAKKLVIVRKIFKLMVSISKKVWKNLKNLDQVLYNCYFILCQKNTSKAKIIILIDSEMKVNVIYPVYAI